MEFICHDCSMKIHRVRAAVRKEISRRLDNGEKYEDMYAEYENQHLQLLEDGDHDTERCLFFYEAARQCAGVLGYRVVYDAGWTCNHSGFMVRDTERIQEVQPTLADIAKLHTEIAELRRKLKASENKIQAMKSRGLLARIFRKGE